MAAVFSEKNSGGQGGGRTVSYISSPDVGTGGAIPMPVNQAAANKYESRAEASRSEYENNATAAAWRAGVDGADSPGQGLANAGVNMAGRESEFDAAWREGVQNGDYRTDPDAWAAGIDGDAWLAGMSDASGWNIG